MRLDPHSFADSDQPQTRTVDLALRADFPRRVLEGEIALQFSEPGAGALDLDTRDLRIGAVESLDGAPLPHQLGTPEPILGARLRILLPSGTRGVRIRYSTSPNATALQWLEPSQTAGDQPFLYSQSQPIHARSLAPLQDTPRIRISIGSARFTVPSRLRTLMAAAPAGREVAGAEAVDLFHMPQPIPPYLLAFAVGDLEQRPLSHRSAVWAAPAVVDAAAHEFAGVEQMMAAAERLFGPYEWDRYDILVMPPSFPYGGMENPRLTFVTPSILAGDRSLVNVIAHELAHAWTGNLVTNASADDFWLNEGFTVYAERRILEALEGRESAEMHAQAGLHDLRVALERFASHPERTRLRNHLQGVDPDEAYSTVPYEKGYLLLRKLEETAGRAAWDDFLRAYLGAFRFQSIVTQQFLDFLESRLPGLAARAGALEFIDAPGLPAGAPEPRSPRLEQIRDGSVEPANPTELLVYLQSLAPDAARLRELDVRWALSSRRSLELRHTFVLAQLRAGVEGAVDAARRILLETGRMRYLRPIYTELLRVDRSAAERIYQEARGGYHHIARAVVEGLLKDGPPKG
ncbi:MAG TPA: M1 family metallopeptidase [Myxococcales bacterium]|nr:M1 family metallopeptidase [Myxococcales bacterium]